MSERRRIVRACRARNHLGTSLGLGAVGVGVDAGGAGTDVGADPCGVAGIVPCGVVGTGMSFGIVFAGVGADSITPPPPLAGRLIAVPA